MLVAAFYDSTLFCVVKKLSLALAAMETHPYLYPCLKCGKQMSSVTICVGDVDGLSTGFALPEILWKM
jgi:hypothetical protein